MSMQPPTLDRLAILDDAGRRTTIHPADVDVRGDKGRRLKARRRVAAGLVALFIALPWLELHGTPLVLLDVPRRSFHLFGLVLNAQDAPLLFFVASAVGFALVVTSALLGRAWCGWACPQTVLLEGVFRRIERLVDGPAAERRALERAPLSASKVARRSLKWSLWGLVALALSATLVAYFVGGHALVRHALQAPLEHPVELLLIAAATATLLVDMGWFREQMCLIVCPYGRLQSSLADEDTLAVAYDARRGEPRGKVTQASAGACIDCRRCVAVCPTGIDIRNGLQLECIGCGLCADACDDIMDKVARPRGLIRTDSARGLRGEPRRILRPRLVAYALAGLVGFAVAAFVSASRTEVEANLVRAPGAPYVVGADGRVTNALLLHVVNRSASPAEVSLEVDVAAGIEARLPQTLTLKPEEQRTVPIVFAGPPAVFRNSVPATLRFSSAGRERALRATLLGPSR